MNKIEIMEDKNWRGYTCQYIDKEVAVFSKASMLYEVTLSDGCIVRRWNFPTRFIAKVLPSSLVFRALREQFYNVIKVNECYFVVWRKEIYFIKDDEVNLIKSCDFRIFRGGVTQIGDRLYFGEYSNNAERGEVSMYSFCTQSKIVKVEFKFPPGTVRHIHAVKKLSKQELIVFTGDVADECRVVVFNVFEKSVRTLLIGDEDYRAIYGYIEGDSLVYATDAQFKRNSIVNFNLITKKIEKIKEIDGPVFYGAKVKSGVFFSIVYEGDIAQVGRDASLIYKPNGDSSFQCIFSAKKDLLSTKYFQFGQVLLPYIGDDEVEHCWFSTVGLVTDGKTFKVRV